MASKNKVLFSELTSGFKKHEVDRATDAATKTRRGHVLERTTALSRLASGDYVEKTLLWVDPALCRMWPGHNRRYDLLDERRCADLIEGFKSQGQQEFPAIVRESPADPDFDYEVVCGARRHWTVTWLRNNNYPQFRFLIEVRDMTDEEAFRLSDIENRDKEDISDYERAYDYQRALKLYYKTQKEMASRLEVSEAWLSRYLDLASLPKEIVHAYADVTQIRIQHGRDLRKAMKDRRGRERILKSARALAAQQKNARKQSGKLLDGQEVVRTLLNASKQRSSSTGPLATYTSELNGKTILTVNKKGRAGLTITLMTGSGSSRDELLSACARAMDEFSR